MPIDRRMPRKSHVDVGDDDVSNENVALLRTNDEEPFDDTQPLAGYNGRRISKSVNILL